MINIIPYVLMLVSITNTPLPTGNEGTITTTAKNFADPQLVYYSASVKYTINGINYTTETQTQGDWLQPGPVLITSNCLNLPGDWMPEDYLTPFILPPGKTAVWTTKIVRVIVRAKPAPPKPIVFTNRQKVLNYLTFQLEPRLAKEIQLGTGILASSLSSLLTTMTRDGSVIRSGVSGSYKYIKGK